MQKFIYSAAVLLLGFTACKKEASTETSEDASASPTIAVAASATIATASQDTVYLLQPCGRGAKRTAIAEADLPAVVATYLSANYAGYTFYKAFSINDRSGATTGYVAVIYYNDKPVGLQFDGSGNFVKVLEQRERDDLQGPGWHHGGRFQHRDGKQRDTIALSALPSGIQSYLSANYAADTLVKAFRNRDSSIVVLSRNNGVFANVFDASGNFVNRLQLPAKPGRPQSIEQSTLPAAVLSYLETTYPNYVFKKAFVVSANGAAQGYIVFIDANNTKYAVAFDASGNFLQAKTIY